MEDKIHAVATSVQSAGGWLQLFDDMVRVETRLYNALNETLRARYSITGSQFEFLGYLRRHPESRVSNIATYFVIGVGAASKGIDRLVASGWVQRVPNPNDGRSSLLRLTMEGVHLADSTRTDAERLIEALLGEHVHAESLTPTATLFKHLRGSLERAAVGRPIG